MGTASPAEGIRVEISRLHGLVVWSIAGEIDADSAAALDAALDELNPRHRVVLDLTRLICRDSTAADLLVGHSQRISQSGGALLMRLPSNLG